MAIAKDKISSEVISGLILLAVLAVVLILANSPLADLYEKWTEVPIHLGVGDHTVSKPALLWVNEGLMAIFFMLLGLEIKHKIFLDRSINKKTVTAPVIASIGGVLLPVVIYFILNYSNSTAMHGWGVATTTDTAIVLAILAILGNRIPKNLRLLMLILSIVDDVLAVFIIAVFYTSTLSWSAMMLALLGFSILIFFNFIKLTKITPYFLVGVFIWFCVLQSGIHATLAGVVIGFSIPIVKDRQRYYSKRIESYLRVWSLYFVLPLFVFMNGGISFSQLSVSHLWSSVSLAIVLGLFLGKFIGAFSFFMLAVFSKLGRLPRGVDWKHVMALCSLSGVGFTMSLFLSTLAFNNTAYEDVSGQAVLIGSLMSLILSISLFLIFCRKRVR